MTKFWEDRVHFFFWLWSSISLSEDLIIFECVCGLGVCWEPESVCVCLPLTFKKHEPAVLPLVGSINISRQTPPEVTDGHGVVIQNPVPTYPPEPTALKMCVWLRVITYCQVNTNQILNKVTNTYPSDHVTLKWFTSVCWNEDLYQRVLPVLIVGWSTPISVSQNWHNWQ